MYDESTYAICGAWATKESTAFAMEYARTDACVHDSRDTQHTNDHRPRAVTVAGGLCFPERFVEFLEGQLVRLCGESARRRPSWKRSPKEISESVDRYRRFWRRSRLGLDTTATWAASRELTCEPRRPMTSSNTEWRLGHWRCRSLPHTYTTVFHLGFPASLHQ